MTKIELKTNQEFKRVLLAALPSYRKHNAYLSVFPESGMDINSYWDGGSKSVYTLLDLTTMQRKPLPTSTHPYFDIAARGIHGENSAIAVSERGNITLKQLPPNFALVESGYFCGKPSTAHIFVPVENMPKLLNS